MSPALIAESLEFVGTIAAAIPPLRLSYSLLTVNQAEAAINRPDVPPQIRAMHDRWRDRMIAALQKWDRTDHFALLLGAGLLLVASVIKIWLAW